MAEAAKRRLEIIDVLLLIGAAALGFGAAREVVTTLLGGQTSLSQLFERPPIGWTSRTILYRLSDGIVIVLTLFGGLTFAFPLIRLRRLERRNRAIAVEPGIAACLAAVFGMIWAGVAVLCCRSLALFIDGRSPRGSIWARIFLIDEIITSAGAFVTAAWAIQALQRRRRPPRDWVDRGGRLLGALWVLAGFVWALRRYAGLMN